MFWRSTSNASPPHFASPRAGLGEKVYPCNTGDSRANMSHLFSPSTWHILALHTCWATNAPDLLTHFVSNSSLQLAPSSASSHLTGQYFKISQDTHYDGSRIHLSGGSECSICAANMTNSWCKSGYIPLCGIATLAQWNVNAPVSSKVAKPRQQGLCTDWSWHYPGWTIEVPQSAPPTASPCCSRLPHPICLPPISLWPQLTTDPSSFTSSGSPWIQGKLEEQKFKRLLVSTYFNQTPAFHPGCGRKGSICRCEQFHTRLQGGQGLTLGKTAGQFLLTTARIS